MKIALFNHSFYHHAMRVTRSQQLDGRVAARTERHDGFVRTLEVRGALSTPNLGGNLINVLGAQDCNIYVYNYLW